METVFRKLRNKTGMKMKQAAEFFGTPYGTWRSWETGEVRTPKIALFALDLLIQRNKYEKNYIEKEIAKLNKIDLRR